MRRSVIAPQLEQGLRIALQAPRLQLIALDGERPKVDEEREPWITVKYGPAGHDDWFGVIPATARFRRAPGADIEALPLFVKTYPREGMARNFMPWIVAQIGLPLDRPYWEYREAAEFERTAEREPQVYLELAKVMPGLCSVLPGCYGGASDESTGERALFLEAVKNIRKLDAGAATEAWSVAEIDEVLRAVAGWQAPFWGADAEHLSWAGPQLGTADMIADSPLWRAIIDDARKRQPHIMTEQVWRRRAKLIDTIADWHEVKDTLPSTLAHGDFNLRNVGFRKGVVLVLDWELAQRNSAFRDLVEFLTFALPLTVDRAQVDGHVETLRAGLVAAGVTSGVDRDAWLEGFRCELKVEALNRAGLQLLFGAKFPLPYVAGMNATIERLLDLYG